ncbi:MAG TPA: DinB family protein [Chloroflexia bacterium]|nr:DinB family protein [Chloroflexia bacterium]
MDRLVPDNNKEVLLHLQEISKELEEELDNTLEEDANFNAAPGEWSVKEIVCHLRDAEHIYYRRLQQMLEDDEPFLRAFNPDELASERDYQAADWGEAVAAFKENRATNLNLLTELRPVQWLKGAIHQERGHITVHDIAEALVQHSTDHLEQIRHVRWLAK